MELRLPNATELRRIYETDLVEAFPPSELKPLSAMEEMWAAGKYKPYCLYDDDGVSPIGTAFLWMGRPGWALLDYLCVNPGWRNDGFGGEMLRMLPQVEPGTVILVESEAPEDAPDEAMAHRRLGFYRRNGLHSAKTDTEIFDVHYKIFYLADRELDEEQLMEEYAYVYASSFTPEKYRDYVRIPYDPQNPSVLTPWDQ